MKQNKEVYAYHKAIAILNHDVSDTTEAFKEPLNVTITSIVWQTTNVYSRNSHPGLMLKHVIKHSVPFMAFTYLNV